MCQSLLSDVIDVKHTLLHTHTLPNRAVILVACFCSGRVCMYKSSTSHSGSYYTLCIVIINMPLML